MSAETIDLEEALAVAMLENEQLEARVAELESDVADLLADARRAATFTTLAPAQWSRERDHTGDA